MKINELEKGNRRMEIMLTFGEAWAKETRNLLNKGLRCKESVVFFLTSFLFWFSLH